MMFEEVLQEVSQVVLTLVLMPGSNNTCSVHADVLREKEVDP